MFLRGHTHLGSEQDGTNRIVDLVRNASSECRQRRQPIVLPAVLPLLHCRSFRIHAMLEKCGLDDDVQLTLIEWLEYISEGLGDFGTLENVGVRKGGEVNDRQFAPAADRGSSL